MSKNIIIKEEDVEEPYDESRDEIVNKVQAPPAPPEQPPATAASPEPAQQKAKCKMGMRELYKCDDCGKYLTKKSLNYSHAKTCKGRPENQIKAIPRSQTPPPQPQQQPPQ